MEVWRKLEQNTAFWFNIPSPLFQPAFSTGKLLCFLSGLHHFFNGPCFSAASQLDSVFFFCSLRICSPVLYILTAQLDEYPSSL